VVLLSASDNDKGKQCLNQNGLRFKRGAVQSMLDFGEEPGIQGLGIQTPEDLAFCVSNAHRPLLSDKGFCPHYGR